MARLPRIVLPGHPHHVTQRGNRRQRTFFCDDDYRAYLDLMTVWCHRFDVRVEAFCLMPNHVHLIATPSTAPALAAAMAEIHRRYTRMVNFRKDWRGHLWQGRFYSVPLDEGHYAAAVPYVEQNPVRAGLTERIGEWRWCSATAADHLVMPSAPDSSASFDLIRDMTRTGRPEGSERFLDLIAERCGVDVRRKRAGRPPKDAGNR